MKTKIWLILFIVCCIPITSQAAKIRNLYIEFSYVDPQIPGKDLTGFRLYKDGVQVCQTNSYYSQSFSCQFPSASGNFDFTLAALFSDNSVGPHSLPYPVNIVSGNSITLPQTFSIMTNISTLLLNNNHKD